MIATARKADEQRHADGDEEDLRKAAGLGVGRLGEGAEALGEVAGLHWLIGHAGDHSEMRQRSQSHTPGGGPPWWPAAAVGWCC